MSTTLYEYATNQMRDIIRALIELSKNTDEFSRPPQQIWTVREASAMLLGGKGYHLSKLPPVERRSDAWLAKSAAAFDLEKAATGLLYERLEPFVRAMVDQAYGETDDFTRLTAAWTQTNAHLLPVMMHAAGTFSKQELKRLVGSVSDQGISGPASERLTDLLETTAENSAIASRDQVRQRMRSTIEGIVRDLVGRLLLEEFVAEALRVAAVPFRREEEYAALAGVVYDFRADFVVPDETAPQAFLEVRKSSTRHASLYAKDKMFSAINWKGRHQECIGVLVTSGPWTATSLEVMGRVFDYVVPIAKVGEVAQRIRDYLDGDRSALRFLIEFKIKNLGETET